VRYLWLLTDGLIDGWVVAFQAVNQARQRVKALRKREAAVRQEEEEELCRQVLVRQESQERANRDRQATIVR